MIATMKFLAALALYPLTYVALASIVGWRFGCDRRYRGVVRSCRCSAVIALRVFEETDDLIGDLRALQHRCSADTACATRDTTSGNS